MGRIDTLTGEAALTKRFSLPSENGSTIKSFIVDPISSIYFARRHLVFKFNYAEYRKMVTIPPLQTNTDTFVNSAYPDETARKKPISSGFTQLGIVLLNFD